MTVSTAIGQLKTKSIAEAIQTEDELEAKICNADTYQLKLDKRIAYLTEFIKKASQPSVTSPIPLLLSPVTCEHPLNSLSTRNWSNKVDIIWGFTKGTWSD